MSDDFFGGSEGDMITFSSMGIEVTGENTAKITGDLTMNDVTKSVVLDAKLNQKGDHPQAGKPLVGFDATPTFCGPTLVRECLRLTPATKLP